MPQNSSWLYKISVSQRLNKTPRQINTETVLLRCIKTQGPSKCVVLTFSPIRQRPLGFLPLSPPPRLHSGPSCPAGRWSQLPLPQCRTSSLMNAMEWLKTFYLVKILLSQRYSGIFLLLSDCWNNNLQT